jgi:hypothetical protein
MRIAFTIASGVPLEQLCDDRCAACVLSLHVRHLRLCDYREALRPPTRFVPVEEEEYEEEG